MTEKEKDNFEKIVFNSNAIKVHKDNDGYIVSISDHDFESLVNEAFAYRDLNWKYMSAFPKRMAYPSFNCINELEAEFIYMIAMEKYIDYVSYISLGDAI